MEEEYRMQKAHGDIHASPSTASMSPSVNGTSISSTVIHEDGSVRAPTRNASLSDGAAPRNDVQADDDASTRAVASPGLTPSHSVQGSADANGDSPDALGVTNGIPIIRVSTESDHEREMQAMDGAEATPNGDGTNGTADTSLEKPVQAAAGAGTAEEGAPATPASQEAFSFTNKRLCERWLDNLFMVLYEVSIPCDMTHGTFIV